MKICVSKLKGKIFVAKLTSPTSLPESFEKDKIVFVEQNVWKTSNSTLPHG